MDKELQKHKTSDLVKWILVLIAFILVAVMFTGIVLGWFDKKAEQPEENEDETHVNSGMVIPETVEKNNVSLLCEAISPSSYKDYGISPQAESACTITATLHPNNEAENTAVNWMVKFADENSAWAQGKKATDYLTVKSNGTDYVSSKTATVECLQPFGEQILIIAISVDNPEITADCTVDYLQKITDFSLAFGNFECNFNGITNISLNVANGGENSDGGYPKAQLESSTVYTIPQEFTIDYACSGNYTVLSSVKPNANNYYSGEFGAFANGVNYGGNGQFNFTSTIENYNIKSYGIGGTLSWLQYAGFKLFSFDGVTMSASKNADYWSASSYVSRFNDSMNYVGRKLFDLTVTVTGDKDLIGVEPYVYETTIAIGSVFNAAKITSASLSETTLCM